MGRANSKNGALRGRLPMVLVGREETQMEQARGVLRTVGDPLLEVAQAQPEEAAGLSVDANVEMVVFGADEEQALSYLQKESEREPQPALFALLTEQSQALMRRVLRAGADEVLFVQLAQGDLLPPLLNHSEGLGAAHERPAERFVGCVLAPEGETQ